MPARPAPLTRDDLDAFRERSARAAAADPNDFRSVPDLVASAADVPALIEEVWRLRAKSYALEMLVRSTEGQVEEWALHVAAGNPAYSAEFVRGAKELSAALMDGVNQHPTWQDELDPTSRRKRLR